MFLYKNTLLEKFTRLSDCDEVYMKAKEDNSNNGVNAMSIIKTESLIFSD